jgi:glycogen debranching enzyme
MDTKPANRKGACIEVQALFLSMIELHNYIASITKSKKMFKGIEKEYKDKVREAFFDGETLYDSLTEEAPSDAVRPNVFLAYYIYPGLLTKKEWKTVFDNILKALWLDWGGLSTINHTNHLFKAEYAGENDASYHNGDSWYYINNYAVHASKEEMLFSGFIGCCAELSSAKQMKSEGCLSQAWSVASLIELLHEMHG